MNPVSSQHITLRCYNSMRYAGYLRTGSLVGRQLPSGVCSNRIETRYLGRSYERKGLMDKFT